MSSPEALSAEAPGSEALVVTQFYRPELIGSAPFCADLAEWLAEERGRVTVLTSFPHYPNAAAFSEWMRGGAAPEIINGVGVERVRNWIPRRMTALQRIASEAHFLLLGAFRLATRRVKRQLLVVSLSPSILSVALGAIATAPGGRHVALIHDIQSGLASGLGLVKSSLFVRLIERLERAVLNRADLVVVLSHEMRDRLRAIGVAAPIEVVPIWVDPDDIRPAPPANSNRLTVLYSGNLGRKQGLGQVVALAEELQRRGSAVEIVLRGNGGEAEAIARDAAVRGLANLRILPLLPRAALAEGLAQGDIHLVPQDPLAADFAVPSKVLNIMAAGRPFVATARPGTSLWRLREESGGFLCIPPNDTAAFADAVERLAGDASLRAALGAQGRSFIERHRDKAQVLKRFVSLMEGARHAG